MKTLKEFAKENGITYRTAWNWFKDGKLPSATKNQFGKVLIDESKPTSEYVVCYARVSSSQNIKNLESQSERLSSYCAAKGYIIKEMIKECASGLNDQRPKLNKILRNKKVTLIVVEHHDRLTRFGFNFLELLLKDRGCRIEVINESSSDISND